MNPPELVLDSTCVVCQSILGTALPSRERSIDKSSALLRPNALALLKSSRTGCHLCNLILGNWFPSVDKWPDGLDAVHLMAKTDHFRDIIVTFEDEPPSYNFEGPFNYLNIHLLGKSSSATLVKLGTYFGKAHKMFTVIIDLSVTALLLRRRFGV